MIPANLANCVRKRLRCLFPSIILFATSIPYGFVAASWYVISRFLAEEMFAKVDDCMWGYYQWLVLFFYENYSGANIYFYGDMIPQMDQDADENILYISNHQSAVDWVLSDMVAGRRRRLGNMRFILKDDLRWIPMYGWYFAIHGCIYVKRAGGFRPEVANRGMEYLARNQMPLFLVIFPEGTRYNVKKQSVLVQAQQFAREKGLEPLHHTLMPRRRGTQLVLRNLAQRLDCVYDVTVIYNMTRQCGQHSPSKCNPVGPDLDEPDREPNSPSFEKYPKASLPGGDRLEAPGMFDFMDLPPGSEVHMLVRRYDLSEVPTDSEELDRWLYERFQEKDRHLSEFYENGRIFVGHDGTASNLPLRKTGPVFGVFCFVLILLFAFAKFRELFVPAALFMTIGGYVFVWARDLA